MMKNICFFDEYEDVTVYIKDGNSISGAPICVNDADETDCEEIMITIRKKERYIGIKISEILRIEDNQTHEVIWVPQEVS